MPPQSIASSGPAHYPAWATVPGLRGHFIALRIYNAASQMQFLTESATAVQDSFWDSVASSVAGRPGAGRV